MKMIQKRDTLIARIDEFAKAGKARQIEAHLLGVSALYQAHKHGDLTACTRLFNSFGKTENPNEYRYWLNVMSGERIKWNKEEGQFEQKAKGAPVQGNCDMERAKREPWWSLEKVQQNRAFNPEQDVKGVVSMLNKHAKEAHDAGEQDLAACYEKMANEAKGMQERIAMLSEHKQASVKEITD